MAPPLSAVPHLLCCDESHLCGCPALPPGFCSTQSHCPGLGHGLVACPSPSAWTPTHQGEGGHVLCPEEGPILSCCPLSQPRALEQFRAALHPCSQRPRGLPSRAGVRPQGSEQGSLCGAALRSAAPEAWPLPFLPPLTQDRARRASKPPSAPTSLEQYQQDSPGRGSDSPELGVRGPALQKQSAC